MIEKIRFKINKGMIICPIFLIIAGTIFILKDGLVSIYGSLGMIAFLLALYCVNLSELSSIKEYLNEERRKQNGNR